MYGTPIVGRPLLLGHRGARAIRSIPENTSESFERALADGCDGFEFDVRLTADGAAVVCHDPKYLGINIADSPAGRVPKLPNLEHVMARFHHRAFLDIELKVVGLGANVASLLRKYPPVAGFVVSSFLPEVLRQLHAEDQSIPLGLICGTSSELSAWRSVPGEYVIPHFRLLSAQSTGELKDAGKKILTWTVNSSREMLRCRDLGVDGIISDDTGLLCRTFSKENVG